MTFAIPDIDTLHFDISQDIFQIFIKQSTPKGEESKTFVPITILTFFNKEYKIA